MRRILGVMLLLALIPVLATAKKDDKNKDEEKDILSAGTIRLGDESIDALVTYLKTLK